MGTELPILPVRGRAAAQDRSLETKRRIVAAAIDIIAERGLTGLTHRLVAGRAGVRLAATTYYYKTKDDIVADVSNTLLGNYASSFETVAARIRTGLRSPASFRSFVHRLLRNAVKKNRSETIVWMELLLNEVRHPENLQFKRQWAKRLEELWTEIAVLHGEASPEKAARSAIDVVIGLQLAFLSLGMDEEDVTAVFEAGEDPFQSWSGAKSPDLPDTSDRRTTPKARATRERILGATMQILVEEGAGAVSYRLVAQKSGLAPAAPAYHFSAPSALLREAQSLLFDRSKDRYRSAMTGVDFKSLDVDRLVDLTAAVFLREATEFGEPNLASYGIWLEAARQPGLRSKIWNAIDDQGRAWGRIFANMEQDVRPLDALIAQCLFIGKLIRITCLGAVTPDLAMVREEFHRDVSTLIQHKHWIQKRYK